MKKRLKIFSLLVLLSTTFSTGTVYAGEVEEKAQLLLKDWPWRRSTYDDTTAEVFNHNSNIDEGNKKLEEGSERVLAVSKDVTLLRNLREYFRSQDIYRDNGMYQAIFRAIEKLNAVSDKTPHSSAPTNLEALHLSQEGKRIWNLLTSGSQDLRAHPFAEMMRRHNKSDLSQNESLLKNSIDFVVSKLYPQIRNLENISGDQIDRNYHLDINGIGDIGSCLKSYNNAYHTLADDSMEDLSKTYSDVAQYLGRIFGKAKYNWDVIYPDYSVEAQKMPAPSAIQAQDTKTSSVQTEVMKPSIPLRNQESSTKSFSGENLANKEKAKENSIQSLRNQESFIKRFSSKNLANKEESKEDIVVNNQHYEIDTSNKSNNNTKWMPSKTLFQDDAKNNFVFQGQSDFENQDKDQPTPITKENLKSLQRDYLSHWQYFTKQTKNFWSNLLKKEAGKKELTKKETDQIIRWNTMLMNKKISKESLSEIAEQITPEQMECIAMTHLLFIAQKKDMPAFKKMDTIQTLMASVSKITPKMEKIVTDIAVNALDFQKILDMIPNDIKSISNIIYNEILENPISTKEDLDKTLSEIKKKVIKNVIKSKEINRKEGKKSNNLFRSANSLNRSANSLNFNKTILTKQF